LSSMLKRWLGNIDSLYVENSGGTMRDSFVPMALNPTHDELLSAIKDGFSHFKQKMPTVSMELVGPVHRDPYVKGETENEWCWISIYEEPPDARIPDAKKYMGAVSTRGDDLFVEFCRNLTQLER